MHIDIRVQLCPGFHFNVVVISLQDCGEITDIKPSLSVFHFSQDTLSVLTSSASDDNSLFSSPTPFFISGGKYQDLSLYCGFTPAIINWVQFIFMAWIFFKAENERDLV